MGNLSVERATGDPARPDLAETEDQLASGTIRHQEVGDRIGALLQHASEWAQKITSEAETEAARVAERSKAAARKIKADAEAEAERILADAAAEAERRIAYAKARVQELSETAEVTQQRVQAMKRRLASVVQALDEEDFDVTLPPDGAPVFPEDVDLDGTEEEMSAGVSHPEPEAVEAGRSAR